MFEIRNETKLLIIVYIFVALIIYYYKPNIIFNKNKSREFGIGSSKTVFCYPVVLIIVAILLFYIFEIILLKKNNLL